MSTLSLPVDEALPALVDALSRTGRVVLEAPPGAGKTTRVPPAILASLSTSGQVWVLEPRRLAARTAARRVAEERGEAVGGVVGYRVRFDDQTSDRTRIVFATEGVLLERLRRDPELRGIDALVFDEFHERHLDGDVILGLSVALARRRRLLLCVMSATLDATPVAAHLSAERVTSEGRRFPVEIRYAPPQPFEGREEPLERSVARAARACLVEGTGDVLVFLPGAREIRAAEKALGERAKDEGVDVVPLHGDLAPDAQDRAIRRGPRRKIILSTNVAETSVTIEGVSAVVDSGLARVASHSPWTGLPTLAVRRVSRASAAQRAGRAGRLGPGTCVRLYSQHDHDARSEHERPEVERADLADVRLLFADQAIDPSTFDWLTAPPAASLSAAETLLERLGAMHAGTITELGRTLARMPLHPRAARLLVEADTRGAAEGGALVAAILGQGGDRGSARHRQDVDGSADLLEEVESIRAVKRGDRVDFDRARHLGLDLGRLAEVDRARKQLARHASNRRAWPAGSLEEEQALLRAMLAAFPDRVAKRLKSRGVDVAFAEGGSGKMDPRSVVRSAELVIAYDVLERAGTVAGGRPPDGVIVRGAARIEADWLLEDQLERMVDEVRYEWNRTAERVDEVRALRYGILSIDETRAPAQIRETNASAIASVLGDALDESLRTGGGRLTELREHLGRALDRLAFLASALPELGLAEPPRLEDTSETARASFRSMFANACVGATRFDEVVGLSATALVAAQLPDPVAARFDRDAPEAIMLGGHRTRVEYPRGQPPFVASRLQDFFGMVDGPKLAGGRVPLTLHLLAPNKRAVQVTQDLAGFWQRHYPVIRKELGRRYPRHKWPDDPLKPNVIP